ncbi:MAG: metallophosphoesterase [Hydrogenoanaerobacterium sp.]
MRIIVMSDSHRNVANVRKIVEKHMEDGDLFLHLGDGERDFEAVMGDYPTLKSEHVCGNCDFYSFAPTLGVLKEDGKKIFFTHGHIYNVKYGTKELIVAAQSRHADIVLYGHTHIAKSEYDDGIYVINPGSCSGIGDTSYAILDITKAGIAPVLVRL